jgi:hypothetical protein
MIDLVLQRGIPFADLYDRDGLVRLDRIFVADLAATDVALHDRLMAARSDPEGVGRQTESDLVVDLAPHLEDFIGGLFSITDEVRALQARYHELAPLYSVKRLSVQRRAVKGVKEADAESSTGQVLPGSSIASWGLRSTGRSPLQNEITSRIAIALNLELMRAEAARSAENPDAMDYIFRGRAATAKGGARENTAEAISLFERAFGARPSVGRGSEPVGRSARGARGICGA